MKPNSTHNTKGAQPSAAQSTDSASAAPRKRAFWSGIVRLWRSPLDAFAWFRANGITESELEDGEWLLSAEAEYKLRALGSRAGRGLVEAIRRDARFQGKYDAFDHWLHPWRDYSAVVASWRRPADAYHWARLYGLPPRKLNDRRWFRKAIFSASRQGAQGLYEAILADPRFAGDFLRFSRWLKRGSIDSDEVSSWKTGEDALLWAAQERLDSRCLLDETAFRSARRRTHKAILQDPRFSGSFRNFKAWLNIDAAPNPIISSWKSGHDALEWAKCHGLTLQELCAPEILTERGHLEILQGILGDLRFGGDFAIFRKWLGVDKDFLQIVRSWRTSADALRWAESHKISWGFLEHSQAHAKEQLEELRNAILSDPRFEGKVNRFRTWLGLDDDYRAIVRSWKTPQHARSWAASRGVTASNLARRAWLMHTSQLSVSEGGIGDSLEPLAEAIVADPRFEGDFVLFRRWLGVTSWSGVVSSWKTPDDARAWARAQGVSWKDVAEGAGRRGDLRGDHGPLRKAILDDPRFKGSLRRFLDWIGGR